jgi:hypothetical protein
LQALHTAIGHPAYGATHIVGNFPNLALQSCTLLDTRHSETLLFFGVNRGRLVGLVKPRAMLVSISSAGLKK